MSAKWLVTGAFDWKRVEKRESGHILNFKTAIKHSDWLILATDILAVAILYFTLIRSIIFQSLDRVRKL